MTLNIRLLVAQLGLHSTWVIGGQRCCTLAELDDAIAHELANQRDHNSTGMIVTNGKGDSPAGVFLPPAPSTVPQGPDVWRPIATLPSSGQALVTDDELPFEGPDYGTIELVNCPMLPDGRLLCQNSANYTRPGVWKWWLPVPSRKTRPT
jgi:hypothetical protein